MKNGNDNQDMLFKLNSLHKNRWIKIYCYPKHGVTFKGKSY